MKKWCKVTWFVVAACLHLSLAQVPPRLHIPGALPSPGAGNYPVPRRLSLDSLPGPRPRRPISNAVPIPIREVRPVVEEESEEYAPPSQSIAHFDSEVDKLAANAAAKQAQLEEDEQNRPQPSVQFRPEKPVPVTRDQIRERPSLDIPKSAPLPPRPLPVLRQESRPSISRPAPQARPIRPVVRQELDISEEENIPRQPIRQKARPAQPYRPPPPQRPAARPFDENEPNKKRKPVVQIIRKYRTDNPDGSITWGFENEDGTFKEETLGTDCIISGKYGYVDPEGVRREFSYEAGNKCDPSRDLEELPEEEEIAPQRPLPKRPQNIGKPQVQFRPQLAQY